MVFTNEFVKKLFDTSNNQSEILKALGKRNNGSGNRLIKKLAKQIGVDLSFYGDRMTEKKYYENPKFCKCCGKKLTYEQRRNDYCSHSCAAKINNKGVVRNGTHVEHNCLNCGKKLYSSQKNNRFCSAECSN